MIEYRDTREFPPDALGALFLSVGWVSGRFPERLARAMAGSSCVVSAWDGGRLIGLVRGLDDGAWQAWIDCLLVDPAYGGRGIASELLRRLTEQYGEFFYVTVVPDERKNVGFYQKRGFDVLDESTPLGLQGLCRAPGASADPGGSNE